MESAEVPLEWRPIASQVVCFDMELNVEVVLNDEVGFELCGEKWWSRSLGKLEVKELSLQFECRCYFNVAAKVVKVAITGEPKLKWDIELALLAFNIPLPDEIEDGMLPRALARKLKSYTSQAPLTIDLGKPGKVSYLLDIGLAVQARADTTSLPVPGLAPGAKIQLQV